jgi:Flp pilus assembly protein TadD
MTDNDHAPRLRIAAVALRDRGRYEDALARFTEAVALDPNDAETWNNVQFCRARLGDRFGSLAAADELVRLRPRPRSSPG